MLTSEWVVFKAWIHLQKKHMKTLLFQRKTLLSSEQAKERGFEGISFTCRWGLCDCPSRQLHCKKAFPCFCSKWRLSLSGWWSRSPLDFQGCRGPVRCPWQVRLPWLSGLCPRFPADRALPICTPNEFTFKKELNVTEQQTNAWRRRHFLKPHEPYCSTNPVVWFNQQYKTEKNVNKFPKQ